mmetsp:Transcript_1842/g.2578  ORF Transcript_1842/g.2578 Transcript_1842/m.2578 type:complete len:573 (+) Transcript_1842:124-1842(+)
MYLLHTISIFLLFTSQGTCLINRTPIPDSQTKFLIDAENVRGRAGFELTHAELLRRSTSWVKQRGLHGKVTLVFDHGSKGGAYWFEEHGVSVAFSGSQLKADDLIARDVQFCQETLGCNVVVVTADTILERRCLRASSESLSVNVLCPLEFLSELDKLDTETEIFSELIVERTSLGKDSSLAFGEDPIDTEIKSLVETISLAEVHLKSKGHNRRKRSKLKQKLHQQQKRLSSIQESSTTSDIKEAVLDQWEYPGAQENMADRLILAERFRQQLEELTTVPGLLDEAEENDTSPVPQPAEAYAQYVSIIAEPNQPIPIWMLNTPHLLHIKRPLRIVVISDTHGYESVLTKEGGPEPWTLVVDQTTHSGDGAASKDRNNEIRSTSFPEGDVLLHLGDFAADGDKEERFEAMQQFDSWLASHPHPNKIVIRGNHDPHDSSFPLSGATFVKRPTSMTIGGWVFSLVPYIRNVNGRKKILVPKGDLLASHVPPKRVLDKCNNGNRAGCKALRSSVEQMKGGPPRLWLCGHIHEGRGLERVKFGGGDRDSTLVLNAANANPGRANAVLHGPVVVELNV